MFAYAFPMFATSPATIMEAASEGSPPPSVVESIMVDVEVASIGKTYANMYRICLYVYISRNLLCFPCTAPGDSISDIRMSDKHTHTIVWATLWGYIIYIYIYIYIQFDSALCPVFEKSTAHGNI